MEPFLWECRNGEELRQREGRQKQGKKVGGTRKEQGEGKSSWKKKVEKQRKGRKRERGKGRNLLHHELGGTGHGGEVGDTWQRNGTWCRGWVSSSGEQPGASRA